MTDRLDFESRLEERIRARAALAVRPFDAAEIARHAVVVNGHRGRLGRLEWPSRHPALGRLVVAVLLAIALLGAAAGVGAFLRERASLIRPDPVPVGQMTVIRQQVDAINVSDVDAFIGTFAVGAVFGPGGDFRESSSLFGNSLPLSNTPLVEAWMAINDAWGFEAEIIACNQDPDPYPMFGYGEGRGELMVVDCEVATRWTSLSLEITERWNYEFRGLGLGHWGFELLDLNPDKRVLPLGYDGLEAWEAWLAATDPGSAARYLNPRSTVPNCEGCLEWQDSLAPGDPERATQLGRLLWSAEKDWSIQGHHFAPYGLIPYDPAFADEIEASLQQFLDSSVSDDLEPPS
jgi:hypothetical protein